MPPSIHQTLTRHLWPPDAPHARREVFAILDGARNATIYPAVTGSRMLHRCLYQGDLSPVLAEAAPYLVQLIRDTPFTSRLQQEGWGESWGIYLSSTASLQQLRSHFRRFLKVKDDTGRALYFRFYDPRVLRLYLPTCTASELDLVFGPVETYFVEADAGHTLLVYTFTGSKLIEEAMALNG